MENRYSAFYMLTPKSCIDCPLSIKSGDTLGCCLDRNARANASMHDLKSYKSCYCPLITGVDDTDFIQEQVRKELENDAWWRAHSSRFD